MKSSVWNSPRYIVCLVVFLSCADLITSFATGGTNQFSKTATTGSRLFLSSQDDDDIARQVAKAKELLESVKAKMAAKEAAANAKEDDSGSKEDESKPTELFFGEENEDSRRNRIIKNKDESTGLVQADGELMAALSADEQWEARSLLEVFESELDEDEDVYSLASQQLASRDVAASIRNLRRQMQLGDYKKIFDSRNRFIGEDN